MPLRVSGLGGSELTFSEFSLKQIRVRGAISPTSRFLNLSGQEDEPPTKAAFDEVITIHLDQMGGLETCKGPGYG